MLTGTLCPVAMVNGKDTPDTANCALLLAADETVTLPPLAPSVVDRVLVLPTSMLPKLRLAGLRVNCPIVVVVPVPLKGIFNPGPETKIFPVVELVVCGVKLTFSVMLAPAERVKGKPGPLAENPPPVVCKPLTVTELEPVLVTTTGEVALLPTATWPNDTAVGLAVT